MGMLVDGEWIADDQQVAQLGQQQLHPAHYLLSQFRHRRWFIGLRRRSPTVTISMSPYRALGLIALCCCAP